MTKGACVAKGGHTWRRGVCMAKGARMARGRGMHAGETATEAGRCGEIDAAAVCSLQLGLLFAVSKNVISFY